MQKLYRYIRLSIAVGIGILSVLAFGGICYPLQIFDIQFAALLQRLVFDFSILAALLFGGLIIFTLLFGRVYCSTLCPFGLLQELLMFIFRRRTAPTANYLYKYFLAAICFGTLIGGTAYLIRLVDPYTLFGSGLSGAWISLGAFILIAILAWFKGRFFCSNICPVGAVLGFLSRYAVCKINIKSDKCLACGLCAKNCPTGSIDFKNKTVNNETCIKCFDCLGACRHDAIHYETAPENEPEFNPLRRKLLISGTVLAAFAIAYKSGIKLAQTTAQKLKKVILPAGAKTPEDFINRCLNCNLCVQNCPMKIIKKANTDYPVIHIDYSNSFCDYDCNRCSEVCPSGAISRISLSEKQHTQIATAFVADEVCIQCGMCVNECPRKAIAKQDGLAPVVDTNKCIGCGTCKIICPVKAISITAVEQQKLL